MISAESPAANTPGRVVAILESTRSPPSRPFSQSTRGTEGALLGTTTTASQVLTCPMETTASALETPRIESKEPSTMTARSALGPEAAARRMAAATRVENCLSRPSFPQ